MDLLLQTLEDLSVGELKKFKLFLTDVTLKGHIPKSALGEGDATDVTSKMVEAYGIEDAIYKTRHILNTIGRKDLKERLQKQFMSVSGLTYNDSKSLEYPTLQCVSRQLKTEMRDRHASILEGPEEIKAELEEVYTELYVTEGVSHVVNSQHEVQQNHTEGQVGRDIIIHCNDIMNSSTNKKVKTVMTLGIAGIGKSVSVQKFCLDWAEGRANHDIDLIFALPFRELNLETGSHTLPSLLQSLYPEVKELNSGEIYNNSKIMFILDGLDESKLKFDFKLTQKLTDMRQEASVAVLLTNLIQGNLLKSSLIWITSRPAAASQIPSRYVDKWTEIRGFNDAQKDQYLSKRITSSQSGRIISEMKSRRSLYIMCHIPVFSWILSCVFHEILTEACHIGIPTTMTELFIHFLLIQTNRSNQRFDGQSETDREKLLLRHKEYILKLCELAFKQLEKGNILFSESELRDSGIEDGVIEKYSEMCTEIFKKDHTFYKKTLYCFVHLSVQEFMAALHVFYAFASDKYNALDPSSVEKLGDQTFNPDDIEERPRKTLGMKSVKNLLKKPFVKRKSKAPEEKCVSKDVAQEVTQMHDLLNAAVQKSVQSRNGHLDLFLRFLLGITLESNQELLLGLLPKVQKSKESISRTSKVIKEILSEGSHSVERCQNLLLCLLEIKDNSLTAEVEAVVKAGKTLTPAQCSSHAYMLMMSEDVLDEFNLTMYNTSPAGYERLLIVLQSCKKAQLQWCNLSGDSCGVIASCLKAPNALKELDLSSNPLYDHGAALLTNGLMHPNCKVETLRLLGCGLTEESCGHISDVLQSDASCLKELDMSFNTLNDTGMNVLSAGLKHPNCRLETLRLESCNLTRESCCSLASSFQSPNSHLIKLDLTSNDLQDSGIQDLCAAMPQQCKLETLGLSGCAVSQASIMILASVLNTNCSLKVDLSYNHILDSGNLDIHVLRQIIRYQIISAHQSSPCRLRPGLKKYAWELTLDPDTAHTLLCLSVANREATRVEEHQPYPDHPKRFQQCCQVLTTEPLVGRCYWEAEWDGETGAVIGVALESISRDTTDPSSCLLGYNPESWGLCVRQGASSRRISYCVKHNNKSQDLLPPHASSRRIGVYLSSIEGTLSFYSISNGIHTHLYTFKTFFTEAVYAGFAVFENSTVSLCKIT